jgi:hypothetical protein
MIKSVDTFQTVALILFRQLLILFRQLLILFRQLLILFRQLVDIFQTVKPPESLSNKAFPIQEYKKDYKLRLQN